MDLTIRFHRRINRFARTGPWQDCWDWTGKLDDAGYPDDRMRSYGRSIRAHAYAYETVNGKMPVGYETNHKCNRRCCVNPDHLEAVTAAGNLAYREILNRLGYIPRPEELSAAIAKHAAIEALEPKMPHLDTTRYAQ